MRVNVSGDRRQFTDRLRGMSRPQLVTLCRQRGVHIHELNTTAELIGKLWREYQRTAVK